MTAVRLSGILSILTRRRRQAEGEFGMATPTIYRATIAILSAAILLGCGGGGQSGQPQPVSANPPQGHQEEVEPEVEPLPQPPAPPKYPTEELVVEQPPRQDLSMPAFLESVPFAGIETSVVRITGQAMAPQRALRHAYAKRQPWNADGSLLLLAYGSPALLLDGRTFESLGTLQVPGDPVWSHSNPDHMFGVSGNSFVRFSILSRAQTVLRTFPQYSRVLLGGGEGNLSNDDRYVALIGQRDDGIDVFTFDVEARTTVATLAFDGASGPHGDLDSASISPSGRYVVIGLTRPDRSYELYDAATMGHLRTLVAGQVSHGDIGISQEGSEVLVTSANGLSALYSIRLDDGSARLELSEAHMAWNKHVSCRNFARPGWCYVSTYWNPVRQDAYLFREIFALKLDGSSKIQRFAPGTFAERPVDLAYPREAHAVPNPIGNLVLYASDWGDGTASAVVHSYVAGVEVLLR
jgi:hypothetical protein